jgi:hypothetical protein
MLSARRVRAFYWFPVILLMSGVVVWLGDINWWDEPILSPSLASPVRMLHSLFGFGLLLLFGTVYWHSKMHWHKQQPSKKITGIFLWLVLAILAVTALALLYAQEDFHRLAVILHAVAGAVLVLFLVLHHKVVSLKQRVH